MYIIVLSSPIHPSWKRIKISWTLVGYFLFILLGTHSIVLMAVCDARYLFTLVEIGSSGRNADGGVFAESEFGKALENNNLHLPPPGSLPKKPADRCPYLFTAYNAFPLKKCLMKPHPGKFLSEEKKYLIIVYPGPDE